MELFKDKRYEEMDWLTRAVEPVETPLNEALMKFPETITLGFDAILNLMRYQSTMRITINEVIGLVAKIEKIPMPRDYSNLQKCFKLEVVDNQNLNFLTKTGPTIILHKVKNQFDENTVKEIGIQDARRTIMNAASGNWEISRLNEIADMVDASPDTMRTRSVNRKCNGIADAIGVAVREDKWRIRNMELLSKIAKWIVEYGKDGNLAAWANLCHFKVMTHNEQPIYSIQEVE